MRAPPVSQFWMVRVVTSSRAATWCRLGLFQRNPNLVVGINVRLYLMSPARLIAHRFNRIFDCQAQRFLDVLHLRSREHDRVMPILCQATGGKPIEMVGQGWNSCFKGKIGLQAKRDMA